MIELVDRGDGTFVSMLPRESALATQKVKSWDPPGFVTVEDCRLVGSERWARAVGQGASDSDALVEQRRGVCDLRMSLERLLEGTLMRSLESGLIVFLSRPCPDSLVLRDHPRERWCRVLSAFRPWAAIAVSSAGVGDEVLVHASDRDLLSRLVLRCRGACDVK